VINTLPERLNEVVGRETLHTSRDLLVLVEQPTELVVPSDGVFGFAGGVNPAGLDA
jgi:hypothetical protein